jgi:RNA polymerase sigma-70 factor (ECF subfamily)
MKPTALPDPSHPVMEAPDVARLVARAQAGDEAAFRALVEVHQDRAYGLALRIVGRAEDAEEVAQDAFVRAWRALSTFRGEAAFGTWLHRIVSRLALDRRARITARARNEEPVESPPEAPADLADVAGIDGSGPGAGGADAIRLDRLLDRLSAQARAAVVLYYYEDRSVAEVAAALAAPEGTVKTLLSRARATLRAALEREERREP